MVGNPTPITDKFASKGLVLKSAYFQPTSFQAAVQ